MEVNGDPFSIMSEEKYAIASTGESKESMVSDQAARCLFYLLFERSEGILKAVENPYSNATGRAAPQAVQFLANMGVTTVIAEKYGEKMISELDSRKIGHLTVKGSVEKALIRFS